MTLVVTPLVSLMEDQLDGLKKLGIQAAKLNASSSKEEVNFVQSVSIQTSVDMLPNSLLMSIIFFVDNTLGYDR